ncbi:hypothetical protein DN069_02930 [Streptacidiphilus pinicola]|uniref:Collagen-like protein n=1 Tax=Streptacidiphilus pinicola TaxID=2219663 RepID=A0A2X0IUT8_9ACTN|nr:hypothetical protein [Streptacidiphilus pinicola]RAG87151.1 hypothetical protein DN069_02930 [Streptacidiphilus pinicola]
MSPKVILAVCLSAAILSGAASGVITGELNQGARGARGAVGAPGPRGQVGAVGPAGKSGSDANLGPLGVCVSTNTSGTTFFVDGVYQPAVINGVPSCTTGTFTSIQPAKQSQ